MPSPFGFKFRQRGVALPCSPSLLPARRFAVALSLGLALAACNQPKASEEVAPDPPASTPFSRALDRTDAAASDLEQRSQEQQQQINGLQGGSP